MKNKKCPKKRVYCLVIEFDDEGYFVAALRGNPSKMAVKDVLEELFKQIERSEQ
jgi:hypothetical protein